MPRPLAAAGLDRAAIAALMNGRRLSIRDDDVLELGAFVPGDADGVPDVLSGVSGSDLGGIGGALPAGRPGAGGSGALGKTKTKTKGKGKTKTKTKGKGKFDDASAGAAQTLFPAFAVRELHRLALPRAAALAGAVWENLDLDPPPGPAETAEEAAGLLLKQEALKGDPLRQAAIRREAGLDLTAYTRPLGIDGLSGYEETRGLFLTVLALCEYIGLLYKDRFNRPRPNQVDPRLRPFLPNPPHAAYPSNHSFQSFAIAGVFTEIAESEPAGAELFRAAREVAENREYAGLHYPSDTEAGRELARLCLPYLIEALDEPMRRAQREWQ